MMTGSRRLDRALICGIFVLNAASMLLGFYAFHRITDDGVIKVIESGRVHQNAHKEFDWDIYLNPSNPEFWDDGAGGSEPPRPFRHVAENPTEENIATLKKWIVLQEEKIAMVSSLMQKLEIKDHEKPIDTLKSLISKKNLPNQPIPQMDSKNIEIAYLYSSTCQACKKAEEVVERLKATGTKVVRIQTDYENGLEDGSIPYAKEYRDLFPVSVTPTFYIKLKDMPVAKIEGYLPYEELLASIGHYAAGPTSN